MIGKTGLLAAGCFHHWDKGEEALEAVEMISESLALVLPEEMQLLYRQKRCGRHRHTLSCFSWSCSAEPFQPAPVQLKCETPRMTTRMRPCSPQDEWRTHFALPKTMRLTSTRHCSDAVSLPSEHAFRPAAASCRRPKPCC